MIGFLVRSVTEDGIVYRWHEYLLYNPSVELPLARAQRRPLEFRLPRLARRSRRPGNDGAFTAAQPFGSLQYGQATVRSVLGEFYWKVEVGEEVATRDLIAPPAMLSFEQSQNEQNISLGLYVPPDGNRNGLRRHESAASVVDRAESAPGRRSVACG